jgi:hypothetical protein
MLTAIVVCSQRQAILRTPEALVRTLAPLVGACVAGLVHDVVLAGPADGDLALLADHAGCAFVEADYEADWLGAALARARRPNLLLLRAGFVPEAGYAEEIEDAVSLLPATTLVMRATAQSFAERLVPALAPVVAVVMASARYRSGADFAALTRPGGSRRLLRSRARRAV